MNLNDRNEMVPDARKPVYWRRDEGLGMNLGRLAFWMGAYRDKLPRHAVIDEAAVLVPNTWHRSHVMDQLLDGGWELFNEATDVVFTNPFGTRYGVAYLFFRHPDFRYRIEVMMPHDDEVGETGFSPLHAALMSSQTPDQSTVAYPIPHLSFRCPQQNGRRGYGMAVQALKDAACIPAMTCQSTYGVFGYFIGNETGRQIYLKPRVNLRDLVLPTTEEEKITAP